MNTINTSNLYYKRTSTPTVAPISLDEAMLFLKLDSVDDARETEIRLLIDAATATAEKLTHRQLITATYVVQLPSFHATIIRLPKPELQAVASVTYYDSSNVQQTLSTNDYWVNTYTTPGYIKTRTQWPATYDRPDAVTITYTSGYGNNGASVPAALRAAILVLVGFMDSNRDGGAMTSTPDWRTLPPNAERVLKQYRVNYI